MPSTGMNAARVAIVTGGSRGIGRQCAEVLGNAGYSVALNYASNQQEGEAAREAVLASGGQAIALQGDVADETFVASLFDRTIATFGGVDVVVHAAGIMLLAPVEELDLAVFDRVQRTNVRGTFVVNQQAARHLREGGSVVNFSSSVVGTAFETYSAYAASKGAVEALTLILARELRGRDITVNTVAPGPTATDLFLHGKDEGAVARLANAVPLERLGTPDDIAHVVQFLTSPGGHWINGQTIRVNGGLI